MVFSQVALRNGSVLWMHTDPVSRRNDSVEVQVINVAVHLSQTLGVHHAKPVQMTSGTVLLCPNGVSAPSRLKTCWIS